MREQIEADLSKESTVQLVGVLCNLLEQLTHDVGQISDGLLELKALLAVPVPHQEPSEDFADVVNWLRATVRDDIGPFTTAFSRRLSQAADVLARRAGAQP